MANEFSNPVWIAGSVSSLLNVLASTIFFAYCFYRIIMDSCGLRPALARRYTYFKAKAVESRRKTARRRHPESSEDLAASPHAAKKPPRKLIFLSRSMRFLIVLQFASFAMSFDKIIGFFAAKDSRFWCVMQALSLNIFGLEMHFWSLIIAIYLFYSSLILPKNLKLHRRSNLAFEILAHIVVHTLTAILVALPYPFGVIGPSPAGWCWIDPSTDAGKAFIYISFYIPVWLVMVLTAIVYNIVLFAVFRTLKNTTSFKSYLKNEKHLKLTLKLLLYPGISLVVWIIPTVNRLLNSFGIFVPVLGIIHMYCISLNGFLNVVVFFLNPLKHIKLLFIIFCCPVYVAKRRKEAKELANATTAEQRHHRSKSVLDTVAHLAREGEEEYEELDDESDDELTDPRVVPLMDQEIPSGVRESPDSDDSIFGNNDDLSNTEQRGAFV